MTLRRTGVIAALAIVTLAIGAAALLSNLAPPPPAVGEENSTQAQVGPGKVDTAVVHDGYTLEVWISPNRAEASNVFGVRITHDGAVVDGAQVTLTFTMLNMQMGSLAYVLDQTGPGTYTHLATSLVMVGHWELSFAVTPPRGAAFTTLVVDEAAG